MSAFRCRRQVILLSAKGCAVLCCKPQAQISRFVGGSVTVMLFYVTQNEIVLLHHSQLEISAKTLLSLRHSLAMC